jgi:hypothetical protein
MMQSEITFMHTAALSALPQGGIGVMCFPASHELIPHQ